VTPAGAFRVVATVYRPDRLSHARLPDPVVRAEHPRIWCDDPDDPNYNTGQYVRWYPRSHEKLRRPDHLYDIVGVLDYNWPEPVPGKGSAIFLHVWRRPRYPTAGCVAFAPRDLEWILARWSAGSRVVIRG